MLDDPEYARALRLGAWFDDAVLRLVAREAANAADAGWFTVCPCAGG